MHIEPVLRRFTIVVLIALFAIGDIAPSLVLAQDAGQAQAAPKRKTLFDMLFGGGQDDQTPQPVVKAPVVVKPKETAEEEQGEEEEDASVAGSGFFLSVGVGSGAGIAKGKLDTNTDLAQNGTGFLLE